MLFLGLFLGGLAWFVLRIVLTGFYTVDQNERAVKTRFGRAERIEGVTSLDDPIAAHLRPEERERYVFPQVRVIPAGGFLPGGFFDERARTRTRRTHL